MTDETAPESDPVTTPVPLWRRVVGRVLRRPRHWLMSPWPAERMARYITSLVLVGGATFAVLQVVHLDLLLADNTPTGGDMGAHVMGPAYLRDHLLPNFQIAGWSNYWYNGFPLYRFYMVIPALLIVLLNVVLPYGIAFKIVTVLGILTLPFCAWCFGRLARFRFPIPELMALGALAFLMDESFSIYGGNIKSTMAGEFSFSIALSLGILGLGLLARGLETGQYRNWTAIVLALSMLSHGIVLIFVVLGALLLWLIWLDKSRAVYGITMGVTAVLLSAFWVVPFLFNHAYMTDMKYGYRPSGSEDSFWDMFFPWPTFYDILVSGFALIGFVSSIVKRNLTGAWLGILSLALMGATFLARESLPVIGLLWNPRLLPFLYLVRLLLMMVGIVDTVTFVARGVRGAELSARHDWILATATAGVVFVGVMGSELFLYREMPGGRMASKNGESVYTWGVGGWDPITLSATSKDALADGWTRYNFGGYEGRPAYGEYKALVDSMAAIGRERGCGRALWENNKDTGAYGTTMALMLLPHWTDGCIGSQEGLFFEASGSTPYHFLSAAAMSEKSSNPVRELRYTDNDASVGVPMLQKLGVKYVMVFTDAAREEASAQGDLTLLDQVGPWNIYEVASADVVVPLAVEPVVVNPRPGDQRERNLELGTSWFQNPDEWAAMPADAGPDSWQRIDVQVDTARRVGSAPGEPGRKVDIVVPQGTITPRVLPAIDVTNVVVGDQDVSFDVSETGVPVLVKISYFPNWEVSGAEGPYRVAPNFMVVVPTSTHVRLEYSSSGLDKGAWALTLIGVLLLFVWRRRGDVVHASAHPYLLDEFDAAPQDAAASDAGGVADDAGTPDDDGSADDATPVEIAAPGGTWERPDNGPVPPAGSLLARMPLTDPRVLADIVKAYDVRGTVPDQMNTDVAHALGVGFARFCASGTVLVARDMRPSGPELVDAFARGVCEQGADVIDLGLASTDLLYYAAGTLDAPGAMFTASHNPAQYNGVKFCLSGARPVGQDTGLDVVRDTAIEVLEGRGPVAAATAGTVSTRNLLQAFADHVVSFVDASSLRPMKVVADTANGMGGLVVPVVFERIPQIELEVMYAELDGTFPNHPADPLQPANQRDLQARVVAGGFDIGLAFDGDADRVFVVDETGRGLSGSTTTAILAAGVLRSNPGATILHNLICSRAVPEVVREHGGNPVRTKVGHSFIKQLMAETGAVFGGEHSAHYYFLRNFRADSGLIASMLMLDEVSRSGGPLSTLREPFERYASSGEINTAVDDTARVIGGVAAEFAGHPQDLLDGLTVDCGDWWFNLRPSNTEPLLRLNLEAPTRDECDQHVVELLALITSR